MLPAFALGLLAALLLAPGLLAGPSLDPAVFTVIAGQLRDGATLYVDAWDHKPPGIYLAYAAAQALLPFMDGWVVAWLISVAATAGTGILVGAIVRRLGVSRPLAFLAAAACVAAMGQYLTALGGGLTEPIASLPLAAALLLALGDPGARRTTLIGGLLAAVLLVAIPLLPGVLAVAALAIIPRDGLRSGAALVLGGLVPVGAVAAWLAATGALGAALEAVIGYSAAYRLTNAASGLALSAPVITWTVLSLLFLILPALLGALAGWRAGGARRAVVLACLGWVGLSIVLFAYQGRFFGHYAIPLAIPLAVPAALGLERLAALAGRLSSPAGRAAVYLPLLVALLISVAAAAAGGRMEWLPVARDYERSERVAATIRAMSTGGQAAWVWGNEPQLYLLAGRSPATSYSYLYPLVTPGYTTAAMVDQALAQLAAAPPELVIDAGSRAPGIAGFQQLLIPRPLTSDGRDLDILEPLRTFVRGNYREGPTVDGWVVYFYEGVE